MADNLSTGVDKSRLPTGEALARPIMNAGQKPSPEVAKAVVAETRVVVAPRPSSGAQAQDTHQSEEHRICAIVGDLETALQGRPDFVDIQPLFDQLKQALEQLLPKVV